MIWSTDTAWNAAVESIYFDVQQLIRLHNLQWKKQPSYQKQSAEAAWYVKRLFDVLSKETWGLRSSDRSLRVMLQVNL